ncbi:MAG: hypothetical protein ACYDHX_15755, partial [Methanothrix sp.]
QATSLNLGFGPLFPIAIPCWIAYESHIFNTNCIVFHDPENGSLPNKNEKYPQDLNSTHPFRNPERINVAHPIELGLVLEGEDAREFLEDLRNPKATKEQIEMFKEAIKIAKEHPVEF